MVPIQPVDTKDKPKSSAKKKSQHATKKQPQAKKTQKHAVEAETESEGEESEADLEEAWKNKNRTANSQSILEPMERNLRSRTKKQTVKIQLYRNMNLY